MKTSFFLLLLVLVIVAAASTDNNQYGIDPDTPTSVKQITRRQDGKKLDLVMSDEFNTDGRGFAQSSNGILQF